MIKTFASVIIITSSLMVSGVYAEPLKEKGGYIGAAYGVTQFEDDGAREFFGAFDLDDSGQAWQIYGGYRFFKYFAVEGRYTDFGDYTANDNFGFGLEVEDQYSALTVHAIGIYPFGQSGFDIYGQLGVGAIFYEAEYRETGFPSFSEDDTGGTFSAGVGVRYTPPSFQHLTIQLAADIYAFETEDVVLDETYNQSLSMVKLGIQYNF
jgi:hypothetical protein